MMIIILFIKYIYIFRIQMEKNINIFLKNIKECDNLRAFMNIQMIYIMSIKILWRVQPRKKM